MMNSTLPVLNENSLNHPLPSHHHHKQRNEILELKKEYDTTEKCMMDYRMSLLDALIQRKLGLKKKQSKAESMINAYLYDIYKSDKEA